MHANWGADIPQSFTMANWGAIIPQSFTRPLKRYARCGKPPNSAVRGTGAVVL